MAWWSSLAKIGAGIAAPFTGGLSTLAIPALGALEGGLSNTQAARTSSGSSKTSRVLRPEQEDSLGLINDYIRQRMLDPGAGLQPLKTAAKNNVNATFADVPSLIKKKYGTAGASGKYGKAARMTEIARLNQLSGLEGDFAQMELQQQDRGMTAAQALLSQMFGSEMSGTNIGPGSVAAGAVGGGAEALMTMMMLNQTLNGSNKPSFGGYDDSILDF